MFREKFEKHITSTYGVKAEQPWITSPKSSVYRHENNRKWFALVMEISKSKLGISSENTVNVVNLKCDLMLIGSLVTEDGIHPAYHMNKNYWITVRLDGSVDMDKLKWLLEISFNLTDKKRR